MDKPTRVDNRQKMMLRKQFVSALAPFPRSTWIHPHVPKDNFDGACKNIWSRAKEADEELGRGQSSPQRQRDKDGRAPDNKPNHRAKEQQKKRDDLGLSTRYEEDKQQGHTDFILPCPYLSGHRHPHVAKPARVLNPVMEEEMKRNEEEAKGKRNLICVPQSSDRRDKQSFAPQPQPLGAEDHTPCLQDEEDPPLPSKLPRDTCKSEDVKNISSSDCNSTDDDNFVILPGVRSCATDSSNGGSEGENNDCEEEENKIPHSSDKLSSDSEPGSPGKDFPLLSTIKAGTLPRPTEPPASGKMHSQWEIPLSVHPHDIPTATLASGVTAHARAPVRGKAKAPQANRKNKAPKAAPAQQEAYDLLADFPDLQPQKKPLALGELRDGNPKAKGAEGKRGLTHWTNQRQESGASHQRRMENVPHEGSSICAGDQKSVLDLQTFGSIGHCISPTLSCEEVKANNQPPPRVVGTDGVDVNARSWAGIVKAGMKQVAAPQEEARPFTFQQIVTINGAEAGNSAAQNKVLPSYQSATPIRHGPRPCNPNRFVRPGNPPIHQHFGAQAYRANCPPGFRCPCFPFQQCEHVGSRLTAAGLIIGAPHRTVGVTIGVKLSQPDLCQTQDRSGVTRLKRATCDGCQRDAT